MEDTLICPYCDTEQDIDTVHASVEVEDDFGSTWIVCHSCDKEFNFEYSWSLNIEDVWGDD